MKAHGIGWLFTAGFLFLTTVAPCPGAVIFSTFGPGDSYNSSVAWTIGTSITIDDQTVAVGFTAPFSATLTSIRIAGYHVTDPNDYVVYLTTDSAGEPDSILDTFSGLAFSASPSILTLPSVTNPALSAGSIYWIVLTTQDPNALGGWNLNDQGVKGLLVRYLGSGGWVTSNLDSPAVEVNGTSTVPEPSTALLMLSGAAALALLRRRTRT